MSDRFEWKHPLPSEREREILTILIEEAAEVQQRATKLLRFGRDEVQPGQELTNAQRLSRELGDMAALVEMACDCNLVVRSEMFSQATEKRRKLRQFMKTIAQPAT